MKQIVLFGAPAAGKGTLAGKIKKILPQIPHISTGDILRENKKNETPLGLKAKEYMDSGKLVPDELVIDMVEDRLKRDDVKNYGYLLDGFPRTLSQAEKLEEIAPAEVVLVLDVPRQELLNRVLGRISCPECNAIYNKFSIPPKKEGICDICGAKLVHRSDDTEETMNKRIDTYEENAGPVIRFYEEKGLVKHVDGTRTMHLTEKEIKSFLEIV
ncbi:MAG: adenylate kinase [Candidatus Lokiarchaeota archaeon]|nr:adenylate kinase [Candidatus Lokiarchaeota archaeon]